MVNAQSILLVMEPIEQCSRLVSHPPVWRSIAICQWKKKRHQSTFSNYCVLLIQLKEPPTYHAVGIAVLAKIQRGVVSTCNLPSTQAWGSHQCKKRSQQFHANISNCKCIDKKNHITELRLCEINQSITYPSEEYFSTNSLYFCSISCLPDKMLL